MSELVGAVLTRPTISEAGARQILVEHWGIDGELRPLPSERDRNFAVALEDREAFVLKLSNATEERANLEFQVAALDRLVAAGVPSPRPVPTRHGDMIATTAGADGSRLFARVMGWVPGRPLATVAPADRSPALLRDIGRVMGRTATALSGWDHPAAHGSFQWNALEGLDVIDAHAGAVVDPARAALLASWRRRLARLGPMLPELRVGVIHNDANDHNVLVTDDGSTVSGLLDMGDAVWSVVANELAVAAAYAALDAAEPVTVIGLVQEGFEEAFPLQRDERDVIVDLIALRLATSVALSAHQSRLDPSDPYLTVSEAAAWSLLERLISIETTGHRAATPGRS
jgi:Ser/Thr protein kinase RdoA (MazF antagonist)